MRRTAYFTAGDHKWVHRTAEATYVLGNSYIPVAKSCSLGSPLSERE